MGADQITKLYREIGKEFHLLGADSVILVHSRITGPASDHISMEIAVSGDASVSKLKQYASRRWESIEMEIVSLEEDPEKAENAYADGIVL